MLVQVRSSGGLFTMPLETRLLSDRKVFIRGAINKDAAAAFFQQVMLLSAEDGHRPVDIFIDSQGGDFTAGMFIHDVVQCCRIPLRVFCIGQACSMAAVIFSAFPKGSRFMFPHTHLLIHEPRAVEVQGTTEAVSAASKELSDTTALMIRTLSQHTGQPESDIAAAIHGGRERRFSLEEAIAFGIADAVASPDDVFQFLGEEYMV